MLENAQEQAVYTYSHERDAGHLLCILSSTIPKDLHISDFKQDLSKFRSVWIVDDGARNDESIDKVVCRSFQNNRAIKTALFVSFGTSLVSVAELAENMRVATIPRFKIALQAFWKHVITTAFIVEDYLANGYDDTLLPDDGALGPIFEYFVQATSALRAIKLELFNPSGELPWQATPRIIMPNSRINTLCHTVHDVPSTATPTFTVREILLCFSPTGVFFGVRRVRQS
ncbi:hypothetical protein FVE85_9697 [Porphyridium purpureum]|uniref:Uncharacterized protein n=1 Tax=Porphyridium purpureum TaxID=35688 RepID=A0A5J4YL84_PORPP|nr:hypothetical protein FVE85_9697 [Porphyridium purpureum]|eukprot:POR9021..scf246_12